ncbi:CHRD domain-containing protein [Granulosicoccus sp.]|nr:CHRD domain-containing protein [Granulosicoccus sp.]
MLERTTLRKGFVTSLLVLSLGLSACASDDDDDGPSVSADATVDDDTDTGAGTTDPSTDPGTVGPGTTGPGITIDTDDGNTTGTDDGNTTGTDDGNTTGTDDGNTTGTDDGNTTGTDDGSTMGTDDGNTTGTDDGETAGTDDGETTGTDDGTTSDTGTGGVTDDGTDAETETVQTVAVALDSASTVPLAVGADDASGTGEFTVDTETGAISGGVTVSGTTGEPTMAHIHQGAVGEAGDILIALEPNSEGSTVWIVPEGAALDEAGIAAFEEGNLYVNVHTDANPTGELRAQLGTAGDDSMENGGDTDTPVAGGPDDGSEEPAEQARTVAVTLDSSSTVPVAQGADDATGSGSFTVDTETGAISGSVTVSGTTGVPTVAHIHEGAPGEAGAILIPLESSNNGTVWTVPEGAALDQPGIEAFENGTLYVNVHTDANPAGELRAQLVGSSEETPASGSITVSFRNLSDAQPMTPPVVILHNAPDSGNGIRYFEVGATVGEEVRQIAENGNINPLVVGAQGQIETGRVSAVVTAVPEEGGELLPGASSSVNLALDATDQVLSVVAMVVCTNDGFTGVDSMEVRDGTFNPPVYDAGSETNVETLDYWVPTCGTDIDLTDSENGVITLHPGQANAEDAQFNFPADSRLLEMTISVNE